MASPASTAAYPIHSSTWDDEAESYLRTVIAEGAGEGRGGVPSTYPTPTFESTWVRFSVSVRRLDERYNWPQIPTTLLECGFDGSQLGDHNVNRIASYLEDHVQKQDRLLGLGKA